MLIDDGLPGGLSFPYFNSNNLVQMRNFIEDEATCGMSFPMTGVVKPVLETKSTCQVPKGNFVQLNGRVANKDSIPNALFYAWDRVDPGSAKFTDDNVPRFVPRYPTTGSTARFLPNLYLASFGIGGQLEEIPPSADVPGDDSMTFRFVARSRFSKTETVGDFDASLAGTFGYRDLQLTYKSGETPLKFVSTGTFTVGQTAEVSWTGGTGLTSQVELLLAVNTMQKKPSYSYDNDVHDLDWISLGVFPNNGATAITVPPLDNPNGRDVSLMIRSIDSADGSSLDCYFFDLKSVGVIQGCEGGTCPGSCGDGTCNIGTENCNSCSQDCGEWYVLCLFCFEVLTSFSKYNVLNR